AGAGRTGCTLGKIGCSRAKVILPPVSSGDSPSSCIMERNSALMSKPVETLGVSDAVLVMMMVLLCGKRTAEPVTALVMSIVGSRHPQTGTRRQQPPNILQALLCLSREKRRWLSPRLFQPPSRPGEAPAH